MNEIWISILESVGLAWWVEVVTSTPACTYYFGPFPNAQEAKSAKPGYIFDLEEEGAQGFQVAIKRCKPSRLTIFDESSEKSQVRRVAPSLSSSS
ncbi:MAG: DUF1816 domain-containing protein [Timaviella obliquedivisa GSE-PSE-MK23-08B]|nr:DUF1816 domain-containing protein [Timaviella obliquedivisa GSE-PSE-MK23-08B]